MLTQKGQRVKKMNKIINTAINNILFNKYNQLFFFKIISQNITAEQQSAVTDANGV